MSHPGPLADYLVAHLVTVYRGHQFTFYDARERAR
jgi:hypothetical protein